MEQRNFCRASSPVQSERIAGRSGTGNLVRCPGGAGGTGQCGENRGVLRAFRSHQSSI